jgi:hypothetical protein
MAYFPTQKWQAMEQWKEQPRKNTQLLLEETLKKGEVSWARISEVTDYDELACKLTLKYLRQKRISYRQ